MNFEIKRSYAPKNQQAYPLEPEHTQGPFVVPFFFCLFGFWILEAKNKYYILLASKIQKPKKAPIYVLFFGFCQSQKPKKATTKGP